jgi:hypothetical protein
VYTNDPAEAEHWRAELAAGRLPIDIENDSCAPPYRRQAQRRAKARRAINSSRSVGVVAVAFWRKGDKNSWCRASLVDRLDPG